MNRIARGMCRTSANSLRRSGGRRVRGSVGLSSDYELEKIAPGSGPGPVLERADTTPDGRLSSANSCPRTYMHVADAPYGVSGRLSCEGFR